MEEEYENKEKISIEFPKNYEKIIDFKMNRLEREYQDTINRNIKEEDLQNNNDFDSESDLGDVKNENVEIQNGYEQFINNDDEFVEVIENEKEENQNKEISDLVILNFLINFIFF